MKKVLKAVAVVGLFSFFIGCAPALQMGVSLIGEGLGNSLGKSSPPPNILLGAEKERLHVGKYDIGVHDGFFKGNPSVIFVAYSRGISVYFEKNNPDDMKMINDFNQMDKVGKGEFIKEQFLKYAKLDLDPIEPEPPKETTVSTPSSLPTNIPTPGFAPDLIKPLQP